ncbi:hypothetical protein GCM10020256_42010 [Streptomyces thermocoprophilus]
MVKVPSDPAQIIVNHASFRVQLGASAGRARSPRIARHLSATVDTARMPAVGAAAGTRTPGRRRPVVWSGRSAPDDTGAHRLLQAVRAGSVTHPDTADAGTTQVIPRVGGTDPGYDAAYDALDATVETPVVGAQRTPGDGARLLPAMRTVGSAYDEPDCSAPPTATRGTTATANTAVPARTSTTPTPSTNAPPAAGATATTPPGTPTTRAAA